MSNSNDDYKVGYKKPPKDSQFKKGQSGNPNGRPKGTKNTLSLIEQVLNEKVFIREGGTQKEVTKTEAVVMRMAQKAMEGDIKAVERLLKYSEAIDKRNDKYEVITDYIYRRVCEELKRAKKDPDVLAMLEGVLGNE